jgi:hypothetical protein
VQGRIYLPVEDLERFGVTEESILERSKQGGQVDEKYRQLMKFQIDRAMDYYRKVRRRGEERRRNGGSGGDCRWPAPSRLGLLLGPVWGGWRLELCPWRGRSASADSACTSVRAPVCDPPGVNRHTATTPLNLLLTPIATPPTPPSPPAPLTHSLRPPSRSQATPPHNPPLHYHRREPQLPSPGRSS